MVLRLLALAAAHIEATASAASALLTGASASSAPFRRRRRVRTRGARPVRRGRLKVYLVERSVGSSTHLLNLVPVVHVSVIGSS
eukprot:SAG31_NODE_1836_length_7126_cov_8.436175_1_plen_84_part_00